MPCPRAYPPQCHSLVSCQSAAQQMVRLRFNCKKVENQTFTTIFKFLPDMTYGGDLTQPDSNRGLSGKTRNPGSRMSSTPRRGEFRLPPLHHSLAIAGSDSGTASACQNPKSFTPRTQRYYCNRLCFNSLEFQVSHPGISGMIAPWIGSRRQRWAH